MQPALVGHKVVRFEAARLVGDGPLPETVVTAVRAQGKYLLVDFDDGTTLETHMKMSGSWHLYQVGERWQRSVSAARAVLEMSSGWVAVCFSAPHVKLGRSATTGPSHLGPDLCAVQPDLEAAVRAFGTHGRADTPIAVALLDQRICCGVGNVYKSEVLFACRLDPRSPVASVDVPTRRLLVEVAHRQLRANLGSGPRKTVPEGLAVYDRGGRPCRRCGTLIERMVQGEHARATFWCPGCQVVPGRTRPDS